MKRLISAVAVAAAFGFSGAHAAETVLEFEGTHGTVIGADDLAFVSDIIVQNGDSNAPNELVYFDTSKTGTQDSDLEAGFRDGDLEELVYPGGVAIIPDVDSDDPDLLADDEAKGGIITFVFSVPVTMESIRFFDASKATVTLFSDVDATNAIGTRMITGLDDQKDAPVGTKKSGVLDLSGFAPVYAITIDLTNTSGAFDNITFEAVPVPGALPLMIGGAAVLTAMGRRRRKS